MNHINYGIISINSPGSAVAQHGDAYVSNQWKMDAEMALGLRALVDATQQNLDKFDDVDSATLKEAASALNDELLKNGAADEIKAKRMVRVIAVTGGQVVIGVLSSGVWEGLASWAGVS